MAELKFLKDFNKEVAKLEGVSTSSAPPRYWYSIGNYAFNRIMSGSFRKCIPQGRITNLAGPSASGKSFVLANAVRSAQQAGAFCLIIDSENALDDEFMQKIGVDIDNNYSYVGVTTINQTVKTISQFLKGYKEEYGTDPEAPQILIAVDSLDMMMTETELKHYESGDQKGDQGQKNKQLKAMLKTLVQDIKTLNVAIVCTSQVYKNQDVMNGEGVWIISDAVKYSASQITLLTKLKLKDTSSSEVTGIRMKCEGYKTRFTKPFSFVVIEVPYETGMDKYSGLLEVAISLGVVVKKGSRYSLTDSEESWYAKDIANLGETIVDLCEAVGSDKRLTVSLDDDEEITEAESKADTKARRRAKATSETSE